MNVKFIEMKIINRIVLILLVMITTACAKIGPDIIQASGNDYNIAIKEGATHIRLGTALYGKRKN